MDEKKGDLYDVAMGAYDGAEVCKLYGNLLLEKISEIYNKSNNGLYREDEGLSIFRNKSDTQLEKIKKKFQGLFKEYDLEITAERNQKTRKLSTKLDDQIQYRHTESNLIYQPLQKLIYQTYPLLKNYSKNQQHTTKIIWDNLDTIRN